jgi:hypothetical protein
MIIEARLVCISIPTSKAPEDHVENLQERLCIQIGSARLSWQGET